MEDNKLIAEFMGLKKYGYKDENYLVLNNHLSPEQMPYHTSWDWLMPVIQQILSETEDELFIEFSMDISKTMFNNNIEKAHKVVVGFINQNN